MFFAFRGNAVTANGGVADMNAVALFVAAAMDRESDGWDAVSYTHLRAHETPEHLVCRLLLEKKNQDRCTPITAQVQYTTACDTA